MRRWMILMGVVALCWAIVPARPVGSQTVIRPSKNDLILKKLDAVIRNQSEILARLGRLEKALAIAAGKGAGEKPKR